MKLLLFACGVIAASFLVPVAATFASPSSTPIKPLQVGSTDAVTVAPHVPVPTGEPCVVNLIQDETTSTHYTYMPPPSCQGPWAKVVLRVDVTESGSTDSTKADLRLGGFTLYEATLPKSAVSSTWEVERDVTDFTALLREAHNGQVAIGPDQDIWYNDVPQLDQVALGAQLLFYRASSSYPAPKTPDALYRILPPPATLPPLPHNIDRAYLDVYNQQPWWFTCVTDQEAVNSGLPFISELAMGAQAKIGISFPYEGCGGGSFAEMLVRVDGTAAGVVPVFPMLSADLSWYFLHTINAPAQPPQMLNHIPYRLDLTPFSPRLDAAGKHSIQLSRPADATLFVYLDKGTTLVSGFVTRNTLEGQKFPLIDDTISRTDDAGTADVSTSLDRDYTIEGYMNTSRGRVDLTFIRPAISSTRSRSTSTVSSSRTTGTTGSTCRCKARHSSTACARGEEPCWTTPRSPRPIRSMCCGTWTVTSSKATNPNPCRRSQAPASNNTGTSTRATPATASRPTPAACVRATPPAAPAIC